MTADIVKSAHLLVLAPDYENRVVAHVEDSPVAGAAQLGGMSGEEPRRPPDAFKFGAIYVGIEVKRLRKRVPGRLPGEQVLDRGPGRA